jgi:hypothetical protein
MIKLRSHVTRPLFSFAQLVCLILFSGISLNTFASTDLKNSVGTSISGANINLETNSLSIRYERNIFSLFNNYIRFAAGPRFNQFSRSNDFKVGSDFWRVEKVNVSSINVFGSVEIAFASRGSIIMNLDLIGASFGEELELSNNSGQTDTAKPADQNVFLYGKNDRGTLNSEFFFQYMLTDSYKLRIGLSHQVIEYEADSISTDKLQRFYNLATIGLDFAF